MPYGYMGPSNSAPPPVRSDGQSVLVANTGSPPDATSIATSSLTSGGMRGLGIVAFIIAQITLKNKTLKIAKNYYKTAKRDVDFFIATHEPGATESVSEAMSDISNPKYAPDLYASAPAGISKSKAVELQWFAARRRMHRYNLGAMRRLDYDMARVRTAAAVSGWNMGRRYELAWSDAHNERRFKKRLAMANLGIGMGNIIREGLATAVENLSNASNEVSNTVASIGNGYFAKQGYEDARNDIRKRYEEYR
jgi:hypothetical protein